MSAQLHREHSRQLVEIAQELANPRLPLATTAAISSRRLAEIACEAFKASLASAPDYSEWVEALLHRGTHRGGFFLDIEELNELRTIHAKTTGAAS